MHPYLPVELVTVAASGSADLSMWALLSDA